MAGKTVKPETAKRIIKAVERVENMPAFNTLGPGSPMVPRQAQPVVFSNATGATVPAYGVMYPTSVTPSNNRPVVAIAKPNTTDPPPPILINGPFDVPTGSNGVAQNGMWQRVLYTGTIPASGTIVGPVNDQWYLDDDDTGKWAVAGNIDTSGKVMLVGFVGGIAPAIAYVSMTKTSGSAGNATTKCSYLYTVKDGDGNTLATGVNPETSPHKFQRHTLGACLLATHGIARVNAGTYELLWINEVLDPEAC